MFDSYRSSCSSAELSTSQPIAHRLWAAMARLKSVSVLRRDLISSSTRASVSFRQNHKSLDLSERSKKSKKEKKIPLDRDVLFWEMSTFRAFFPVVFCGFFQDRLEPWCPINNKNPPPVPSSSEGAPVGEVWFEFWCSNFSKFSKAWHSSTNRAWHSEPQFHPSKIMR